MSNPKILVERDGDVMIVRLNDPSTLNSVTTDMGDAIREALEEASKSCRAVMLAGGERGFCSGANLSGGRDFDDPNLDVGASLEGHYNPLMMTVRNLPIPMVSAVRGPAAGVGASLALCADLIVAGDTSYFLEAFARIGLVPDGGATWLLTRAIGRPRAMEMMMLAEKIPAEKALEWGLINRVVPDAKVEEEAMALAQRLAKGPSSLGLIRRAGWIAAEAEFKEALATERAYQREAGLSPDFKEGVTAFREKRPAKFGG